LEAAASFVALGDEETSAEADGDDGDDGDDVSVVGTAEAVAESEGDDIDIEDYETVADGESLDAEPA
jgi:hypothetical protein